MNKYLYILFAGILSSNLLQAKIGCMDNSWHLKKTKYDSKEYHYVACDCPCKSTIADRNQCRCCKHYHDTEPWIIISRDHQNPAVTAKQSVPQPKNALHALRKLIVAHKRKIK